MYDALREFQDKCGNSNLGTLKSVFLFVLLKKNKIQIYVSYISQVNKKKKPQKKLCFLGYLLLLGCKKHRYDFFVYTAHL